MDEDWKWMKIDKVPYEDFLEIAILSSPSGALTNSDVIFPDDVHPGKEKEDE